MQEGINKAKKIKMDNNEPDLNKVPLEVIVQSDTMLKLRVKGLGGEFDGVDYSNNKTYTLTSAGEDAPGVYKIEVMLDRHFGHRPLEREQEKIVTGKEKAIRMTYQMALFFAQHVVTSWNEWAEAEEKYNHRNYRRAILVDDAKDKIGLD